MTFRRWAQVALVALVLLVGAFGLGRMTAAPAPAPAPPGPVDVGFSQDMTAHHSQAIVMASLADGRAGPTVVALATSILTTQSQEVGAMQGWLRLWGRPATSATPMSWMPGHGAAAMAPGDPMPGMATPDDMLALWSASGPDFDTRFLQLMIRHHQGGVTMAGYAATHADLEPVREAARGMQLAQGEEIGQMRAVLAASAPPSSATR